MSEKKVVILIPLIAAMLVAVGILALLSRGLPGSEVPVLEFSSDRLKFVMGSGREVDGMLEVETYANGFALITTGPINVLAASHTILRADIIAATKVENLDLAPAFFWRRAGSTQGVSRITLDGRDLVDLSESDEWEGQIVEAGFLFPEHAGVVAKLDSVSIEPETLVTRLRLMLRGWFEFEPWSHRSINYTYGGAREQAVTLLSAVIAWVVLTALGFMMVSGRAGALPLIAVTFLAGWMLIDVRWTLNGLRQLSSSLAQLAQFSEYERMAQGTDGEVFTYVARLKRDFLGQEPVRILLIGDPAREEFYPLRAKYHLLPHSASTQPVLPSGLDVLSLDYVLFLGEFVPKDAGSGGQYSDAQRILGLPMGSVWRETLRMMDLDREGILYAVRKSGQDVRRVSPRNENHHTP